MSQAGRLGLGGSSGGDIQQITPDSGVVVIPAAGNVDILGGGQGRVTPNLITFGAGDTLSIDTQNSMTLGDLSAIPAGTAALTLDTGDLHVLDGRVYIGTNSPVNPFNLAIEQDVDGLIGVSIANVNAGANASVNVQHIVEAGTDDAYSVYGVQGGTGWSVGLDNSDGDSFKIAEGNSPSAATSVFRAYATGDVEVEGSSTLSLTAPAGGMFLDNVAGNVVANTNFVTIDSSTGEVGSEAAITNTSGTWTPTLTFGGASAGITYSTQEGQWRRIGDVVFVWGRIILTSKGSSTGTAELGGLPFRPLSTVNGLVNVLNSISFTQDYISTVVLDSGAAGYVAFFTIQSGAGNTQLSDTNFVNTSQVFVNGSYIILT